VTEYAADGTVRLDLRLPPGGESYRAFRFPWRGQPVERPRLHARARDRFTLYATWNGATDVAAWQLRTGDGPGALRDTALSASSGFETALGVPPGARYADVLALDRRGAVLGHAPALRI
jgi:hypothetical protein